MGIYVPFFLARVEPISATYKEQRIMERAVGYFQLSEPGTAVVSTCELTTHFWTTLFIHPRENEMLEEKRSLIIQDPYHDPQ